MKKLFILIKDNLFLSFKTKKGFIFVILYLLVFGLITYGFIEINHEVERQLSYELERQGFSGIENSFATTMTRNMAEEFATDILVTRNDQVINFLIDIPFLNIMLFLVSLFGTPLLIIILKYDAINSDTYDGSMRYLLFRVSRTKIVLAKFISSVLEFAILTLISLIIAFFCAELFFEIKLNFWHGLRFWALSHFMLSIFSALAIMFSVLFKKPFHSLIFCFVALFSFIFLAIKFDYISPFDEVYFSGFFYNYSPELLSSLAAYSVFSILFLGIGIFVFNRKNL